MAQVVETRLGNFVGWPPFAHWNVPWIFFFSNAMPDSVTQNCEGLFSGKTCLRLWPPEEEGDVHVPISVGWMRLPVCGICVGFVVM
jgi:hypothetical protein